MNFTTCTKTDLDSLKNHYNLVLDNLLEQLDFNPYNNPDHDLTLQYYRMSNILILIDEELNSRIYG